MIPFTSPPGGQRHSGEDGLKSSTGKCKQEPIPLFREVVPKADSPWWKSNTGILSKERTDVRKEIK